MKSKTIVLVAAISALSVCLALAGCGSGKAKATVSASAASSASSAFASAQTAQPAPVEPSLGSTVEFDGMAIAFGDAYGTATLDNQFSDHFGATVIAMPVTITNNNSKTHGLNMFAVKAFGPQGTELDSVFTYFDDDVRMMGDLRPGASSNGNLYFLYDGNGDYYLDFGFYRTDVEVKIPVSL